MTTNDNDTGNGYGWLFLFLIGGFALTVYFLTKKPDDPNSWENYPTTTTYTTHSGSSAAQTLSKMGYKDIRENGMTPFVCPEDEYSTVFSAKDPVGKPVSGVVCCPLVFGRCSVRHDN